MSHDRLNTVSKRGFFKIKTWRNIWIFLAANSCYSWNAFVSATSEGNEGNLWVFRNKPEEAWHELKGTIQALKHSSLLEDHRHSHLSICETLVPYCCIDYDKKLHMETQCDLFWQWKTIA